MPNHVENDLTVRGPAEELERMKEFVTGENEELLLDADKIIPSPEGTHTMEGFNSGGYQWCLANWGTKWGFYDARREDLSPTKVVYHFNTAWSPAVQLVDRLASLFPLLAFKWDYFEGGMGFQGHVVYDNGTALSRREDSYSGHRGG